MLFAAAESDVAGAPPNNEPPAGLAPNTEDGVVPEMPPKVAAAVVAAGFAPNIGVLTAAAVVCPPNTEAALLLVVAVPYNDGAAELVDVACAPNKELLAEFDAVVDAVALLNTDATEGLAPNIELAAVVVEAAAAVNAEAVVTAGFVPNSEPPVAAGVLAVLVALPLEVLAVAPNRDPPEALAADPNTEGGLGAAVLLVTALDVAADPNKALGVTGAALTSLAVGLAPPNSEGVDFDSTAGVVLLAVEAGVSPPALAAEMLLNKPGLGFCVEPNMLGFEEVAPKTTMKR